jgi:hypothetical protein
MLDWNDDEDENVDSDNMDDDDDDKPDSDSFDGSSNELPDKDPQVPSRMAMAATDVVASNLSAGSASSSSHNLTIAMPEQRSFGLAVNSDHIHGSNQTIAATMFEMAQSFSPSAHCKSSKSNTRNNNSHCKNNVSSLSSAQARNNTQVLEAIQAASKQREMTRVFWPEMLSPGP